MRQVPFPRMCRRMVMLMMAMMVVLVHEEEKENWTWTHRRRHWCLLLQWMTHDHENIPAILAHVLMLTLRSFRRGSHERVPTRGWLAVLIKQREGEPMKTRLRRCREVR